MPNYVKPEVIMKVSSPKIIPNAITQIKLSDNENRFETA